MFVEDQSTSGTKATRSDPSVPAELKDVSSKPVLQSSTSPFIRPLQGPSSQSSHRRTRMFSEPLTYNNSRRLDLLIRQGVRSKFARIKLPLSKEQQQRRERTARQPTVLTSIKHSSETSTSLQPSVLNASSIAKPALAARHKLTLRSSPSYRISEESQLLSLSTEWLNGSGEVMSKISRQGRNQSRHEGSGSFDRRKYVGPHLQLNTGAVVGKKSQKDSPELVLWNAMKQIVKHSSISEAFLTLGEKHLQSLLEEITPTVEERELKKVTFDALAAFLKSWVGDYIRLYAAGSTAYDVDSASSDLDVVIATSFEVNHLKILEQLSRTIKSYQEDMQADWPLVNLEHQVVESARVPILLLKSPRGFVCDVSVNTSNSILHTEFFKAILREKKHLRALMRLVKFWVKLRNIPPTRAGGLPSIVWMLLCVFACRPSELFFSDIFREDSTVSTGAAAPALAATEYLEQYGSTFTHWMLGLGRNKMGQCPLLILLGEFFSRFSSRSNLQCTISIAAGLAIPKHASDVSATVLSPPYHGGVWDELLSVEDPAHYDHSFFPNALFVSPEQWTVRTLVAPSVAPNGIPTPTFADLAGKISSATWLVYLYELQRAARFIDEFVAAFKPCERLFSHSTFDHIRPEAAQLWETAASNLLKIYDGCSELRYRIPARLDYVKGITGLHNFGLPPPGFGSENKSDVHTENGQEIVANINDAYDIVLVLLHGRLMPLKLTKICADLGSWWSREFLSRRDIRSVLHGEPLFCIVIDAVSEKDRKTKKHRWLLGHLSIFNSVLNWMEQSDSPSFLGAQTNYFNFMAHDDVSTAFGSRNPSMKSNGAAADKVILFNPCNTICLFRGRIIPNSPFFELEGEELDCLLDMLHLATKAPYWFSRCLKSQSLQPSVEICRHCRTISSVDYYRDLGLPHQPLNWTDPHKVLINASNVDLAHHNPKNAATYLFELVFGTPIPAIFDSETSGSNSGKPSISNNDSVVKKRAMKSFVVEFSSQSQSAPARQSVPLSLKPVISPLDVPNASSLARKFDLKSNQGKVQPSNIQSVSSDAPTKRCSLTDSASTNDLNVGSRMKFPNTFSSHLNRPDSSSSSSANNQQKNHSHLVASTPTMIPSPSEYPDNLSDQRYSNIPLVAALPNVYHYHDSAKPYSFIRSNRGTTPSNQSGGAVSAFPPLSQALIIAEGQPLYLSLGTCYTAQSAVGLPISLVPVSASPNEASDDSQQRDEPLISSEVDAEPSQPQGGAEVPSDSFETALEQSTKPPSVQSGFCEDPSLSPRDINSEFFSGQERVEAQISKSSLCEISEQSYSHSHTAVNPPSTRSSTGSRPSSLIRKQSSRISTRRVPNKRRSDMARYIPPSQRESNKTASTNSNIAFSSTGPASFYRGEGIEEQVGTEKCSGPKTEIEKSPRALDQASREELLEVSRHKNNRSSGSTSQQSTSCNFGTLTHKEDDDDDSTLGDSREGRGKNISIRGRRSNQNRRKNNTNGGADTKTSTAGTNRKNCQNAELNEKIPRGFFCLKQIKGEQQIKNNEKNDAAVKSRIIKSRMSSLNKMGENGDATLHSRMSNSNNDTHITGTLQDTEIRNIIIDKAKIQNSFSRYGSDICRPDTRPGRLSSKSIINLLSTANRGKRNEEDRLDTKKKCILQQWHDLDPCSTKQLPDSSCLVNNSPRPLLVISSKRSSSQMKEYKRGGTGLKKKIETNCNECHTENPKGEDTKKKLNWNCCNLDEKEKSGPESSIAVA